MNSNVTCDILMFDTFYINVGTGLLTFLFSAGGKYNIWLENIFIKCAVLAPRRPRIVVYYSDNYLLLLLVTEQNYTL